MIMFKYPADLVELIKVTWKENKSVSEYYDQLPDDETLKKILEIAYHASFMTEESRRVRFSIIYCEKSDERIKFSNCGKIVFENNRDFNVQEIFRLAPATDPTNVLISVYVDENNDIKIWGLLDIGSSWRNFIRGESGSAFLPPGFLTILSSEPGNLTISCAGITLIDLRQGRYFKPVSGIFNNGPIADFFKNSKDNICSEIVTDIGSEFDKENSAEYDDFRKSLQGFVERVLFQIREKFHGGTLIVVPDSYTTDDNRLKEMLLIKYPCIYDRIWKDLVSKQVLGYKMFKLMYSEEIAEKNIPSDFFHEFMFLNDKLKHVDHEISDAINFISSLSEIDGAIVMSNRLRLLGFGAEVIVKTPIPNTIRVAHDGDGNYGNYIFIDSFGTRHRSAFRFCFSLVNSVAFVISKDGSLRAVKRNGKDLILWQDLALFTEMVNR
jgi:hypothetical protein